MAIHTHEEWEEVSDKDEVMVNTSRLRETKYETLSPSRAVLEEGMPSTTKQSKVKLKPDDRHSVELHMRMSQETEQTVNGNSATKIRK